MLERYDRFWAGYFGIAPSEWNRPGISIHAHVGLKGYQGAWCFRRLDRIVVSAPDGWIRHLTARLGKVDLSSLMEQTFLRELFGDGVDRIIGPAYQGFLLKDRFTPIQTAEVKFMTKDQRQAIDAFRQTCGDDGWSHSGLDQATEYVAAVFEGSTIVSMAGYRPWKADAGDPCVLTDPARRGRGYGASVMSAVVESALNEGKLLLCQTLESNIGAIKIARHLGYEQYARHMAVRLTHA